MRPGELWRHSSFRLALGVTFFILATLAVVGAAGFGAMTTQLAARQDARVREIFNVFQQTQANGGQSDLIEAIGIRIKATPSRSAVYLLRDRAGKVLAGNIADIALPQGWITVPAARLGVPTDYPFRVFTGQVGPYSLTIGLTNADLDDLREIVQSAFGWAALFVLLATLVVGSLLAVRVQRRLARAEAAVARVALGDLTARLPVSGHGDDLDRMSQAINASLARLEGLVEAMRQVSADIAHDLRTPLNRLRIHIEEAARKSEAGSDSSEDLAAALAQSEAIDGTFSALLRIAQIEAGARRQKFAPVDLAALMTNAAEVYADVAEDAGHSLRCEAMTPAWVLGDKELLTQSVVNLIENAIRHCPPGATILCGVRSEGAMITAFVADTGPGIPEAERDKVLRRLYRLEKSRTTEGSGLGLALVKAVADLHDACLRLSDAGPGLRVSLTFQRTGGAIPPAARSGQAL
ncbi:MAG: HAMP domain-containing protein [Limimaricola sp.]|uniref:sensor histidine kinase n=1 Tax=Limimaricola sp. TaxID=2211665 RepID=UPI001D1BF4AA|nr:HAMP domain-containing sensor histidine kinase [Limimaricola sp.]MBI1418890.1 HAMP domain-containing protein [Limimaricola sp.]